MENLINFLKSNDLKYDDRQIDLLEKYMDEILLLNRSINLTAITDRQDFVLKHYIDSLTVAVCSEFRSAHSVIDIGTGGGFPGIPLAVLFPDKKFLLADSLNKRIKIISELCKKLEINNVTAVHGRAEELARKEYRETFDICLSRAVANMSTLAEYCLPFVRKGGCFVAYKGPGCQEELAAAEHAIRVLGGRIDRCETALTAGQAMDHTLVFIDKQKNTPKAYPRKAGTPSKEPL